MVDLVCGGGGMQGDAEWSLQLVAQGGLQHLADVLYRQDQLLRGNLSKHCLLALLEIIESTIARTT
jgi:hypothetical protein